MLHRSSHSVTVAVSVRRCRCVSRAVSYVAVLRWNSYVLPRAVARPVSQRRRSWSLEVMPGI